MERANPKALLPPAPAFYANGEAVWHPDRFNSNRMFANPHGQSGVCACCRSKKGTVVNEVCLDCAKPERKNKHR